jgi:serine kinase of HPr protein (carbohydrate metabolism regulator)
MEQVHGTAVSVNGIGVLISGPSGSGKSDLALRLMDANAILIADDRIDLRLRDEAVVMSAPDELSGLIEVRGLGIHRVEGPESGSESGSGSAEIRLGLAIDLVARNALERMPEPQTRVVLGISIPLIRLYPFDVSAVAKVRLAAGALNLGILPSS